MCAVHNLVTSLHHYRVTLALAREIFLEIVHSTMFGVQEGIQKLKRNDSAFARDHFGVQRGCALPISRFEPSWPHQDAFSTTWLRKEILST